MITSSSWLKSNLDLRRQRDEIDAAKKRQEQERQSQAAAEFAQPSDRKQCPWGACADAYRL